MLEILNELHPPLRPNYHHLDSANCVLLTGDQWAPSMSELIKNSTKSISVCAFALTPKWPRLISAKYNVFQALVDAAERGVTCKIVFATHKTISRSGHFNLKAQQHLFDAGWHIRWHPRARLLHAKFFIFDGQVVVIGSHNVSRAAAASNVDMSVAIEAGVIVEDLEKKFFKIWSDSSKSSR